jgi:hypothetical protein
MIDILPSLPYLMYSFVLPYCGLMNSEVRRRTIVVTASQRLISENPRGKGIHLISFLVLAINGFSLMTVVHLKWRLLCL